MEDMLKKLMEQQSTFNKNMTDSMAQQTQALKRQGKVQDDMNIKINEIKKIVNTLNEHEVRLGKLEQHNESLTLQITALNNDNQKLSSEFCLLKQSDTIYTPKLSSEIIMSGIPQTHSTNPLTATSKILHSIGASHQVDDILDIRSVNKQQDNSTSTLPTEIKSTFIINFKSPQIANHIIDKKRRVLTIKQVFDIDRNGSIYINEFLNAETHSLYGRVKEVARDIKCKYVWVKQGCIFARMNDGADKIHIRSIADLDTFKAS
ncbi:hypothetical protein PV328_010336 [Microctonus aethiopoides]|uniref:FP protein C-terminal domain-containing protein n=1 Tax=Microctonus aethiopoides TaxID=144406 RepID=A0AA39C7R4_9HYME|nr:hypothetical protein PV328_010336 [Microctonus aethiopoides]